MANAVHASEKRRTKTSIVLLIPFIVCLLWVCAPARSRWVKYYCVRPAWHTGTTHGIATVRRDLLLCCCQLTGRAPGSALLELCTDFC